MKSERLVYQSTWVETGGAETVYQGDGHGS